MSLLPPRNAQFYALVEKCNTDFESLGGTKRGEKEGRLVGFKVGDLSQKRHI